MAVMIKCKMCGGDLNVTEGVSVVECEYCGSRQTIPNQDSEKKLTLFARADRLRRACEFDKAAGVYESIVAEFPEEAEAYWGLVLCRYGIEYVDDPATGKKVPTCHRSSFDSILEDADFDQACENADPIARRQYREEAKSIEDIRRGILEVSSKEEPYDIFICYKETDENGGRTIDSVIAQDVYDALTEKGYRVFFSRISLEDKLGTEYEPYIFAALNSAKVMLAFGTDFEYFNAVWVKNEWSRFLALMAAGQKKTLIPCYKGVDAYDMPKEFQRLQAQDMGKVGAIQDLLRGIGKIIPRETAAPAAPATPAPQSALTERGMLFLEDGDWAKANEYFERALDENPKDGGAYLGKVLAAERVTGLEELKKKDIDPERNRDFSRAMQFSTGAQLEELQNTAEVLRWRQLGKRLIGQIQKLHAQEEKKEVCMRYYQDACKYMEDGDYDTAALFYGYAEGYLDSESKRAECLRRAEEQEAEERQRLLPILPEKRKKAALAMGLIAAAHNGYPDSDSKELVVGVRTDGTVECVGNLGGANLKEILSQWKDITAVAANENNVIGLTSHGSVVAAQRNYSDHWILYRPVSQWRDIKAIALGTLHVVGLKTDGTVVAAGECKEGQCRVDGWTDIVAVAAGLENTVGLKSDGTVVAAGKCTTYNWKTRSVENITQSVMSDLAAWREIVGISVKNSDVYGLKADGTVLPDRTSGKQVVALRGDDELMVDGTVGIVSAMDWTDLAAFACVSFGKIVGLKTDGTVVAKGFKDEKIMSGVRTWKLFNSIDTLEQEREAIEAERRRQEAEAKAKAEAEAKAKAEAERQAKIDALNTEKQSLQAELPTLKGLFSGGKRRQIEARLAQIEAELKKL